MRTISALFRSPLPPREAVDGERQVQRLSRRLRVRRRRDGGDLCLDFYGVLDATLATRLEWLLSEAGDAAPECVVVDLAGVVFIDPRCATAIVDAHDRLAGKRALLLKRAPTVVRDILADAAGDRELFFLA